MLVSGSRAAPRFSFGSERPQELEEKEKEKRREEKRREERREEKRKREREKRESFGGRT